ncbi:hypothetical protein GF352_01965 [archaeon]|nr:hypothetical protein [archaeon]
MKSILSKGRSKILLALTILLIINTALAFCNDADFDGTITGEDNELVPGAVVTVNCPGKSSESTTTNNNGYYDLPEIKGVCAPHIYGTPTCTISITQYNYYNPQKTGETVTAADATVNIKLDGDNVCLDPDPCNNDYCSGDSLVYYSCRGDDCDDYDNPDTSCCTEQTTDCYYGCFEEPGDDRCKNSPCDGVTCPNYCDGDTRYYNGYCSGGACYYDSQYCSFGCTDGECNSDPCGGVTCDDYCDGDTRYFNGYCDEGSCQYTIEECDYGCSNNYCNTQVLTNTNANVDYSLDTLNYFSCTGDGTKTHVCSINNTPFYLSSNPTVNGYLLINNQQSSNMGSSITLDHDSSLLVNLSSVKPVRGLLNVSPYNVYDISSIYESSGLYYLPVPTGSYTVSYTDSSNRYSYAGGGENVNLNTSSQTSPEKVTLSLTETTYTFILTLTDDNDNNALITNADVYGVFDSGDNECTNNGDGTYSCEIPHNTAFNIKAVKNGYVTEDLYTSPQIILGPQAEQMNLIRTLRIGLMDDFYQPVDTGMIYVDDDEDNNLLTHDLSGNTDTEFYFDVSPQTIKAYYLDGYEFSPSNVETTALTSNSQTTVSLGTEDTWPTDINVNTQEGSLSDYTLWIDGEVVQGTTFGLNQYSHEIKVNKTGYLTAQTTLPSMNNGSPVNFVINHTLSVNVSDQNNDPASGKIKIYNSSGVMINEVLFSNGTAWVPVDPLQNDEALNLRFESNDYVDLDDELPINVLNDQSTYYVSLDTHTLTKLSIRVEDYYSNLELDDADIRAWNNDTTYCTSSDCRFELFNPPEKVNITASKEGYFEQTLVNKSTSSGTLGIELKPRAVIFTNVESNSTIINTKKTSSSLDDEEIMNVSSNENGTNSLPLDIDVEFMIRLWADGYYSRTIGPFTTTSDDTLVIASEDDPEILEALYNESGDLPPVITGMAYSPSNPSNIEDITLTINATDVGGGNHTIDICYYRVDGGLFWDSLDSDYDDYQITASKNIGPLSNGTHNVSAVCHDVNDSLGPEEHLIISIGSGSPVDDEGDEDDDEEVNDTEPGNQTISKTLRLSSIRKNYEVIIKTGLNNNDIAEAVNNAEVKINTNEADDALSLAEEAIPTVTLVRSGSVKAGKSSSPEQIAYQVTSTENQPYSLTELKNLIKNVAVTKTAKTYQINGVSKTLIKLTIYSQKDNPNAVVADFNPDESSAPNTITTSEGSISYFKGLSRGENVFEYVINGEVSETIEPVVFEMKPLSDVEKTIKGVTGFSIGVPGVIEVPVIYLGIGAAVLFLIIKFFVL